MPAEPLHLPVMLHRKAGVQCNGSVVPEQHGDQITLKCNQCGAEMGTINAAILLAWEQAITDSIIVHKFDEADAPEVLTSISEECQRGDCEHCPGRFHRADHGDDTIFCVHSCHEVEAETGPIN